MQVQRSATHWACDTRHQRVPLKPAIGNIFSKSSPRYNPNRLTTFSTTCTPQYITAVMDTLTQLAERRWPPVMLPSSATPTIWTVHLTTRRMLISSAFLQLFTGKMSAIPFIMGTLPKMSMQRLRLNCRTTSPVSPAPASQNLKVALCFECTDTKPESWIWGIRVFGRWETRQLILDAHGGRRGYIISSLLSRQLASTYSNPMRAFCIQQEPILTACMVLFPRMPLIFALILCLDPAIFIFICSYERYIQKRCGQIKKSRWNQ